MNEHTVHVHSVHTDAMNYNNNKITKRLGKWTCRGIWHIVQRSVCLLVLTWQEVSYLASNTFFPPAGSHSFAVFYWRQPLR